MPSCPTVQAQHIVSDNANNSNRVQEFQLIFEQSLISCFLSRVGPGRRVVGIKVHYFNGTKKLIQVKFPCDQLQLFLTVIKLFDIHLP